MAGGEDLMGTFYEMELQKVTYSPDQTFEVEWELDCRGVVEKKKCLSSGKVGLTSSTAGWLWIQSRTSRHECHILFYERHQSEGDTTSRTGYGEQRMFAI